jgi:K+-transporting ATPase ATPase A chain
MQLLLCFGLLAAVTKPLGSFMARVHEGKPCGLDRLLGWLERGIYRIPGVDPKQETTWLTYAVSVLLFSTIGFVSLYALLALQGILPLNPQSLSGSSPDLAFDTAVSFTTNTNWQSYGGETTMSCLSQLLGLTVQNFVSAAAGMAVLMALIRRAGQSRRQPNSPQPRNPGHGALHACALMIS